MTNPIILVDLDSVLADFELAFLTAWQQKYPKRAFIPLSERSTFYILDQYPAEFKDDIKTIQSEPGFFATMSPISGAIDAMLNIKQMGYQTTICSSPLFFNRNSIAEKIDWIERHLGTDSAKRAIFTKDKTLVRGNILIDDRPDVVGLLKPTWKQILLDAPYNENSPLPRMNWQNWEDVLPRFL